LCCFHVFQIFIKSQNLERDGGSPFGTTQNLIVFFVASAGFLKIGGAKRFFSWFSIKFKNSYKITFGLSFLFCSSASSLRLF